LKHPEAMSVTASSDNIILKPFIIIFIFTSLYYRDPSLRSG